MSVNIPTKSSRQINQKIFKDFVADVSNQIMRRRLCEARLFECIARDKKNFIYSNEFVKSKWFARNHIN